MIRLTFISCGRLAKPSSCKTRSLKDQADAKRALEFSLIDQADQTWVVSPVEQELLRRERPNKSIEIVSNIVDVPGSPTPFSLRKDILFIGSFQHPPNADAVIYFAEQIFPSILARLPGLKFYIIGDKAPPEVVALSSEEIVLTGLQPNVQPYFDNIKLSVAPLRYGAGVKGKINQSMGFGVPVVATTVAVEGMALKDHEDVMIADKAEDFAAAVVNLYQSETLWTQLSSRAIQKTRATYSREAAAETASAPSQRGFAQWVRTRLGTDGSENQPPLARACRWRLIRVLPTPGQLSLTGPLIRAG